MEMVVKNDLAARFDDRGMKRTDQRVMDAQLIAVMAGMMAVHYD